MPIETHNVASDGYRYELLAMCVGVHVIGRSQNLPSLAPAKSCAYRKRHTIPMVSDMLSRKTAWHDPPPDANQEEERKTERQSAVR